MRRSTGTVTVYEVVYDTGRGGGPAGDGTAVYRSTSKREADAFASTHTMYGGAASATMTDAPRHIAARWGFA